MCEHGGNVIEKLGGLAIPSCGIGSLHTFFQVASRVFVMIMLGDGRLTRFKGLAGYFLNPYTFLSALTLAYAYTYGQDNPTRQVSFFIITFDAKYLPFALLFMTMVMDGPEPALAQATGLIAAHMFDFLTRIWPTFGGGTNYITTPATVKGWFGGGAGTQQARPYGMAQQGRSAAAPAASGRTTGASNPWGPGRRLGE